MHNQTISWNGNWIRIFICFVGRLLLVPSFSSSSSFVTTSFLIKILKMDKRFFKNLVLHIPHRLRDFLWIVWAWSSVAPIFYFSYYEPSFILCVLFREHAEGNHFLLAHFPRMNESLDPGRPFKVVITIYVFSTSSSTASSCSLIWETLVKYDCMVSAFWIFTFFNWFLKVIFWFMFFP